MTIWNPELVDSGPLFLEITRALESDIRGGRLRTGDRLPTHRELAERLGVNVGTVSRAYAEGRRRGLIRGEVGRGTFVAGESATPLRPIDPTLESDTIDLGINLPLSEPGPDLRAALRALAEAPNLEHRLSYRDPGGAARTREAGATWLRRCGLDFSPSQVVVCSGSQHAILVALASVVGPGEEVLCETLTYPGFIGVARLLGLRLRPVDSDAEGIVPESLEAACVAHRPRLLYCMPRLHNPTTAVTTATRRARIAEIAQSHDLTLVEDDVQLGMLEEDDGPKFSELAPDHVISIVGLSKTLMPGLRISFVAGAEHRAARLGEIVWSSIWMASPLGAELAAEWIGDGSCDRVIAGRRREMTERHAIAASTLEGLRYATRPFAYHVWLELPQPWRADAFAEALARRGVVVTPASAFLAAPSPAPEAVRVSLSGPRDRATLRRGLERIRELASSLPDATPVRL
jgi:DNA-binding transcriptional MocR family regulator